MPVREPWLLVFTSIQPNFPVDGPRENSAWLDLPSGFQVWQGEKIRYFSLNSTILQALPALASLDRRAREEEPLRRRILRQTPGNERGQVQREVSKKLRVF